MDWISGQNFCYPQVEVGSTPTRETFVCQQIIVLRLSVLCIRDHRFVKMPATQEFCLRHRHYSLLLLVFSFGIIIISILGIITPSSTYGMFRVKLLSRFYQASSKKN